MSHFEITMLVIDVLLAIVVTGYGGGIENALRELVPKKDCDQEKQSGPPRCS